MAIASKTRVEEAAAENGEQEADPEAPVDKSVFNLLSKDRAKNLDKQRQLREGLVEAIINDDPAEIESYVNRGASLQPHYYSSRVEASAGGRRFPTATGGHVHSRGYFTAKGPKSGLVNPVDWAMLNGNPRAALQILQLGDGRVVYSRDEVASFLGRIDLARESRRAVNLAAKCGDLTLLAALLERGGDVGQRNALGESSLLVAVRAAQAETARYLLELGAWPLEEDKQAVLTIAENNGLDELFGFEYMSTASRPASRAGASSRLAFADGASAASRPTSRASDLVAGGRASPVTVQREPLPPRPATSLERPAGGGALEEAMPPRPATSLGFADERAVDVAWLHSPEETRQRFVKDILGLKFDLGYGETGNCVDWVVVKDLPRKAVEILDMADSKDFGRSLATNAKAAFFWAIVQGYTDVLHALLSRGCDIGRRHHLWSGGDSALDIAVFGSRGTETEALLKHGAWDLEDESRRKQLLTWAQNRPRVLEAFRNAGIVKTPPRQYIRSDGEGEKVA
eukprot:TRINITY_DN5881_c0_g2_i3.p1 TRINITY_DN5881_c0_g2~~TRINITY_DN5881_c0_g2_i3.p1  ORF type:complete len:514 (+),score=129.25 TRINITY_DN5881_c0_g2_i3:43-1584(+)